MTFLLKGIILFKITAIPVTLEFGVVYIFLKGAFSSEQTH